jgi:hypothetical protein
MNRFYSVFAFVAIALIGCSVAWAAIPTREPPTAAPEILETPEATELPREVITMTTSLFLLVDDNEAHDPQISTHRTEAELKEILQGMNGIWNQAGIRLELETVDTVEVPEEILQGMMAENLRPFSREVGGGITIP